MIFWGWGGKNKTQELGPGQALVLSYRYCHVFFLFQLAWGFTYSVATLTEHGWLTRPLTQQEADSLDASRRLSVHWWWRWGFVVFFAALFAFVLIMIAASS